MAQMLIRKLDDNVVARLKNRAIRRNTSVEEEARRALAASVSQDSAALVAEFDAIASAIGPLPGPTSTELLREDRDRDG